MGVGLGGWVRGFDAWIGVDFWPPFDINISLIYGYEAEIDYVGTAWYIGII
uniref:Uncharacterized protein n=1 Tax=Leishmania sp. TaxID=28847 RepID=Q33589_9TRYP|nr:unnamed protein product [Leishmania sp.]